MIKASFYAGIYPKNTFEIAQTRGEKEVFWSNFEKAVNKIRICFFHASLCGPSSLISQISPGSRASQDTSPDGRLESWNGGNYFIKINWKKYTTEENVFLKQVSTSETLVKGFNFG